MTESEGLEQVGRIIAYLIEHDIPIESADLYFLHRHFIERLNCRPLVGMRPGIGTFTAETYIYRKEKSTAGVPHWERVFSPFSYDTYEEALLQSLMQSIDNL